MDIFKKLCRKLKHVAFFRLSKCTLPFLDNTGFFFKIHELGQNTNIQFYNITIFLQWYRLLFSFYQYRRMTGAFTPKSPSMKRQLVNGYQLRDTNDRLHRDQQSDEPKKISDTSSRKHIGLPTSYIGMPFCLTSCQFCRYAFLLAFLSWYHACLPISYRHILYIHGFLLVFLPVI